MRFFAKQCKLHLFREGQCEPVAQQHQPDLLEPLQVLADLHLQLLVHGLASAEVAAEEQEPQALRLA